MVFFGRIIHPFPDVGTFKGLLFRPLFQIFLISWLTFERIHTQAAAAVLTFVDLTFEALVARYCDCLRPVVFLTCFIAAFIVLFVLDADVVAVVASYFDVVAEVAIVPQTLHN